MTLTLMLGLAALVVATGVWTFSVWPWRSTVTKRKVILANKDGVSYQGLLWAKKGPLLVLREVTRHDGRNSVQLDNEVVLQVRDVDFIQRES